MILKTLTHDRGESDCWNYYADVESASVYYNADTDSQCVAVRFRGGKDGVIFSLTDVAYLCNDRGETIERLGHKPKTQKSGKYPCGK